MALGRAHSVALAGLQGHVVEVEADVGSGLPAVHLVGLPDTALQEARDRVRAAIVNTSESWPRTKIVFALSPATLPKVGSLYDLALACAVLNAQGTLPGKRLRDTALLGELALDGRVRAVRGVLPAVLAARAAGWPRIVVPSANLGEVAAVGGIEVCGTEHLAQLTDWLRGRGRLAGAASRSEPLRPPGPDLADVVGQAEARRALEIAAAGAHNLMLTGSPGVGKTLLAQRLPGVLPMLNEDEGLEATAVHSMAGLLTESHPRVSAPPFVAPHHTTSVSAMVGGGAGFARPGAVSVAHRGVLLLDECPELPAKVLEALRTPLEDGEVRIARRDGVAQYPARFQLVLAANPCPCAPAKDVDCVCTPNARRRYLGRLSGPLLDRVDLRVTLRRPASGVLTAERGESSEAVRDRVVEARAAAAERWRRFGWTTNGEVPGAALRRGFALSGAARAPIETAVRHGRLTPRGVDRCLRVAWSISDLAGHASPSVDDTAGALYLRDRGAA